DHAQALELRMARRRELALAAALGEQLRVLAGRGALDLLGGNRVREHRRRTDVDPLARERAADARGRRAGAEQAKEEPALAVDVSHGWHWHRRREDRSVGATRRAAPAPAARRRSRRGRTPASR